MKRRGLIAGLVGSPWLARAATPGVDAPPEPGPPRPIHVPRIDQERLANGVQLLIVPRPGTPLVTASLYLRAGRVDDSPGKAGLAQLTNSLLTKGARRGGKAVPATQLARQAEALGSTLDTGAHWRTALLTMTVATPQLDAALALIADVARSPLLAADELERLRKQSLDALAVTLANPADVAALASRRLWWGESAYAASPTPASLARITRDDVRRFHAERYRAERAVLVLAGDVQNSEALRLAQRHLGRWRHTAPAPEPADAAPARSGLDAPLLIEMPGSGQSGVVVAAPFIALGSPDRRIAEVANALLGGGYSARLNQEVRIKRGLSYGAVSGIEAHEAGGWLTAQATTDHPNAAEVAQVMREQLLRIGAAAASADELDARKAALIGSFARQLETTAGLAAQVASVWFQGRPLADLARYVEEVLAVTPEQVRDFAARTWRTESIRTVVTVDAAAAGDKLAPLAEGARRVPIGALDLESPQLRR
jgi:zinc protease